MPYINGTPHNGSETSAEAAAALSRATKKSQQSMIVKLLFDAGVKGMTNAELVDASGIPLSSVNPRANELFHSGGLIRNGDKRTSPTSNRGAAINYHPDFAPTPKAQHAA